MANFFTEGSTTTHSAFFSRSCGTPSGMAMISCSTLPDSSRRDRKSTRLNSSHEWISYAVFCLKKKIKLDHAHQYSNGRAFSIPSNDRPCFSRRCSFVTARRPPPSPAGRHRCFVHGDCPLQQP